MPFGPPNEVADLAAKLDGAESGMKGHLPARPARWGQIFAPLTTVVNTFGGTWFNGDWLRTLRASRRSSRRPSTSMSAWSRPGEAGAPAGFTECSTTIHGKTAMVMTPPPAAARSESAGQPEQGQVRVCRRAGRRQRELPAGSSHLGLGHQVRGGQQEKERKGRLKTIIAWASSKNTKTGRQPEPGWRSPAERVPDVWRADAT